MKPQNIMECDSDIMFALHMLGHEIYPDITQSKQAKKYRRMNLLILINKLQTYKLNIKLNTLKNSAAY